MMCTMPLSTAPPTRVDVCRTQHRCRPTPFPNYCPRPVPLQPCHHHCDWHSYESGYHLHPHPTTFTLTHHSQEDQSGGNSANYDVKLYHSQEAHRDILRAGETGGVSNPLPRPPSHCALCQAEAYRADHLVRKGHQRMPSHSSGPRPSLPLASVRSAQPPSTDADPCLLPLPPQLQK